MAKTMSGKREFKLLAPTGEIIGTYAGSCPYQAAMKAASRGHESIMLCEHFGNCQYADKVHMYRGTLRTLTEAEQTAFAQSHKIKRRPEVTKIGIMNKTKKPTQ